MHEYSAHIRSSFWSQALGWKRQIPAQENQFIHKIETVFCRHTHELELMRTTDLYCGKSFTQYMCGSLSSINHANDDNMFLYYENLGDDNMHLLLVRIFEKKGKVEFKEETIF